MSIISINSLLETETNAFRRGIIKKFFFGSDFKCSTYKSIHSINVGKTLLKNGQPWLHEEARTGNIYHYVDGICTGFNKDLTVYFNGADSKQKVIETEGFIDFCKEFSCIDIETDNLLDIRNKLDEVIIEWNNLSTEDL